MSVRWTRWSLFTCFFFSGFAGLADQIVWTRLAYACFGINVQVLSVVLSVFMLGLLLGALFGTGWAEAVHRKFGLSPLGAYVAAECVIALGAWAVPRLFQSGRSLLLSGGAVDSGTYLILSALAVTVSILPFCVAMGATFPLVMTHLHNVGDPRNRETSFSYLYTANVLGALAGTILTALVLVEILGFRGCLGVAMGANLTAAALSAGLALRFPLRGRIRIPLSSAPRVSRSGAIIPWMLFLTGFSSMGMEVVWIRTFTPVLNTQVYSFAALLATYLAATYAGSLLYRRWLAMGREVRITSLIGWTALTSLIPVVVNDPRVHYSPVGALASIVPFCVVLGFLTPRLVDEGAKGLPGPAGRLYSVNLLGCILGPLVAGYLLLPWVGAKHSLLLFAAPLLAVLGSLYVRKGRMPRPAPAWGVGSLFLAGVALFFSCGFEEYFWGQGRERILLRDHTATVVASGTGGAKNLHVNGIGITSMTTITKYMAHLPLLALDRPPSSALVICLGMGTSFRSCLSWGIPTTAVELVPSVRDLLPFFFPDMERWREIPGARIVIDDGRRFLDRTDVFFDVISIDPPPPSEAAGSSLLYSREFYASARKRLAPGGVLQQWLPQTIDFAMVHAVGRSLADSFPCVVILPSFESYGLHYLASDRPIRVPHAQEALRKMPLRARQDLFEWTGKEEGIEAFDRVLRQVRDIRKYLDPDPLVAISDDRPFNEYYLLRRRR